VWVFQIIVLPATCPVFAQPNRFWIDIHSSVSGNFNRFEALDIRVKHLDVGGITRLALDQVIYLSGEWAADLIALSKYKRVSNFLDSPGTHSRI
jgi:hypothetical protein